MSTQKPERRGISQQHMTTQCEGLLFFLHIDHFVFRVICSLISLLAEKSKSNWAISLEDSFTKIDRDLLDRAIAAVDKHVKKYEVSKSWPNSNASWGSSSHWQSGGQKRKWEDNYKPSKHQKHGKHY